MENKSFSIIFRGDRNRAVTGNVLMFWICRRIGAVAQTCFAKRLSWKNSQKRLENSCSRISFLIKSPQKRLRHRLSSVNFVKFFRTFFRLSQNIYELSLLEYDLSPAGIWFKVNSGNTEKTISEICSKLTIKTAEQH